MMRNPCALCSRDYQDCDTSCPRIEEYRARRQFPHIDRRLAYKHRHRMFGLCTQCSGPALPGKSTCEAHRTTSLARRHRNLDSRRAAWRCLHCGSALDAAFDGGGPVCSDCISRRRNQRRNIL